jgi:hypothetical protein
MLHQLIDHNEDLQQLRVEGYDLQVCSGYLAVKGVPYLSARGMILRGVLVSPIDSQSGNQLGPPANHQICFIGDHPCGTDGLALAKQISRCGNGKEFPGGLKTNHEFSAKPRSGKYRDYHHKLTTYIALISAPAIQIDPEVTPQTCAVSVPTDPGSPFNYDDTASTKAGISAITEKLANQKVGIVGLGGTGSYLLDFVSKTSVSEIHIYDEDDFLNHNAFRTPGAPSFEQLCERPTKIEYLGNIYSRMHKGIQAHPYFITEQNSTELHKLDFVFVAVDEGASRKTVIDGLLAGAVPFIDVGMGVNEVKGQLRGQLRVTTCTPTVSEHRGRAIPTGGGGAENEYDRNIQIAELNAMNAAMAVIRWKKWSGFYLNQEHEHHCLYTIGGNIINNAEHKCASPSEPNLSR